MFMGEIEAGAAGLEGQRKLTRTSSTIAGDG